MAVLQVLNMLTWPFPCTILVMLMQLMHYHDHATRIDQALCLLYGNNSDKSAGVAKE